MKYYDIVILGGGTAGWFTAAALVKMLPKQYKICVVESHVTPKIGVGESVTPHVQSFLSRLDIDTHHWMNETGAVYKLANKFSGWVTGGNETEFFSFDYPTDINNLFKDQSEAINVDGWKVNEGSLKTTDAFLSAYSKGHLNKFDRYFNSQYHYMVKNKSPFIGKDYLLNPCYSWSQHINAEKSGEYVKKYIAAPAGVDQIITDISDIKTNEKGIDYLVDQQGEKISAKLFVDASGFHRKLASALNWGFINYSDAPIDRSWVVQIDYDNHEKEMVNHTQSIAKEWGWIFKIGLFHRMGTGYCFSSSFVSDEKILNDFINLNPNKRFEPRLIKWTPGRLKTFAEKNTASIGLSSGFIEPLEANGMYILISGIYNLIEVLRNNDIENCNWQIFNEKMSYCLDDLKDFLKVHYTLSKRTDSEFWLAMQEIGKKENHSDLVKSKYFNKLNSMEYAGTHWTLFPDYMWMQFAISWGVDTSTWLSNFKPEVIDLAAHYFKSRERKHDLISNSTMNSFEWHKKEIFKGLDPKQWERMVLLNRT